MSEPVRFCGRSRGGGDPQASAKWRSTHAWRYARRDIDCAHRIDMRLHRVVIDVADVILVRRLDSQIVEQPEQLCPVICAVMNCTG